MKSTAKNKENKENIIGCSPNMRKSYANSSRK